MFINRFIEYFLCINGNYDAQISLPCKFLGIIFTKASPEDGSALHNFPYFQKNFNHDHLSAFDIIIEKISA